MAGTTESLPGAARSNTMGRTTVWALVGAITLRTSVFVASACTPLAEPPARALSDAPAWVPVVDAALEPRDAGVEPNATPETPQVDGDEDELAPKSVAGAATHSTRDVTSSDGSTRIFVRTDASRKVDTSTGESDYEELVMVRNGQPEQVLLHGRGIGKTKDGMGFQVERTLTGFDNLSLSIDGKTLFFTSRAWVTSDAVHAVDLASGASRYLTDGLFVQVIEQGPFRGRLFVLHYRLDDRHPVGSADYRGRIPQSSILEESGRLVRKLPENPDERERFLRGQGR